MRYRIDRSDEIEALISELRAVISREIHEHGMDSPVRTELARCAAPLVNASGLAHERERAAQADRRTT